MRKLVYALLCTLLCAVLLLPSGCGMRYKVRVGQFPVEEQLVGEGCRFADGTAAFLWENRMGHSSYQLQDGAELVEIRAVQWPWNDYSGQLEGFHGMSEEAQKVVQRYLEEMEPPYDINAILEDAYDEYLQYSSRADEPEAPVFQSHVWEWSFYPVGETEQLTNLCMCVTMSQNAPFNSIVTEESCSLLFDRATGERLDAWTLFTVPEDEVRERLFSFDAKDEMPPRERLKEALKGEYLYWEDSGIYIRFPLGDGRDPEDGWIFDFTYEELKDSLQPWVIPTAAT